MEHQYPMGIKGDEMIYLECEGRYIKIKDVNMSVIRKEKVNTPFGDYNSIVVSPKSNNND